MSFLLLHLLFLKFQTKKEKREKKKQRTIVIECGAHAREWTSISTCVYIINEVYFLLFVVVESKIF